VRVFDDPVVAEQIVAIGYGSQAVVIVTGAFTGAVFTFQSYAKFKDFGMETSVGAVVSVALFRELGPVLAGLMVAGRVGAAMAADIGTMKVTEQVDALRVMGVHPVDYLVLPRLLGMVVSMPLLVAQTIAFGLAAAHLVAQEAGGVVTDALGQPIRYNKVAPLDFGLICCAPGIHQAAVERLSARAAQLLASS
jgi:phospholipid/cholesterol/gamma-HCH transport system permease protein